MNRNNREHQKEYMKRYYQDNKEKIKKSMKKWMQSEKGKAYYKKSHQSKKFKEYMKEYNKRNKIVVRRYQLKFRYGITIEEYNNLLKLQNNVCVICGQPETRLRKGKLTLLSVDHNHETGKIRGLLCYKCNTIIGLASDSPKQLLDTIKYLEVNK